MTGLVSYFTLWAPADLKVDLGAGAADSARRNKARKAFLQNLVLYLGLVIGVFGQQLLSGNQANLLARISLVSTVTSFIVAAVILPVVYQGAELQRNKPNFMRFFICVQHGYFWPQIIESLGKGFSGS